jgi:OHCU decarboxylase
MYDLSALNTAPPAAFLAALGDLYEHSPWVVERAAAFRPFASLAQLHAALRRVVDAATPDEQLALIRAHPDLAGREASEGTLTTDSSSEQRRLGIDRLSRAEFARIAELNRRYRERFGFPCIIALALHADRASVFRAFESRLANSRDVELETALEQIHHITNARLARRVRDEKA